jgi:hypothetical protein
MRTFVLAILAFILPPIMPVSVPHAAAGDEPFTYPSNIGLTGLLETPTARVMKENRYRVGASQAHPYRTYFGTVGLFERLEVNARITEVIGIPGFANSSYGNTKDKAVDIKLQFLPEGKYTPALALAILDPHGTRIYPSQAIVASKQVYPFDFTVGFGNGRLGRRPLPSHGEGFGIELFQRPKEWWKDAQFFGGIQFAPSEKFAFVAEYSPIRYHLQTTDSAQKKYFPGPVASRINAGIRWKPTRWSEIDASYQRGNQVSIAASVAFDIGKPMIPIYDPPYREPFERRQDPAADRIAAALRDSGFSDIGVESDGLTLRVEAQNDRYFFNVRAIEVVLDVIAGRIPENIDYVRIVLKDNGVPLIEFVTTAHGVTGLHAGKIAPEHFIESSAFKTGEHQPRVKETSHRRWFTYGWKPTLETFLNDPSGFFKYRFGLSGWLTAHPWQGGSAILGVEGYPVNTVSTSVAPLSIPVRSDIAEYKKEDIALGRLMFEQIVKTPGSYYGKLSAGLLEVEYAGVDGEVAAPLLRGRILAGASGSLARKRDPHDPFKFRGDNLYRTAFLNARLNVPEHDVHFDVKAGRFLAGDTGARFTVSKFINGVVLSAWYSVTDTTIFSDSFNRGYHEKGISVDIPIRLFTGHDSKTSYRYALSPWTRDVAQDVDHYRTLFDIIGRNTGICLDKDKENLYRVSR